MEDLDYPSPKSMMEKCCIFPLHDFIIDFCGGRVGGSVPCYSVQDWHYQSYRGKLQLLNVSLTCPNI